MNRNDSVRSVGPSWSVVRLLRCFYCHFINAIKKRLFSKHLILSNTLFLQFHTLFSLLQYVSSIVVEGSSGPELFIPRILQLHACECARTLIWDVTSPRFILYSLLCLAPGMLTTFVKICSRKVRDEFVVIPRTKVFEPSSPVCWAAVKHTRTIFAGSFVSTARITAMCMEQSTGVSSHLR